MNKKIKTGIIGAGRIGKIHTENIKRFIPEAEIKTIADIFVDKIREWVNDLDIKYVTKDYKEIIDDPEINAVLICSPTDTHTKYIIEAAEAGKNIFCEKPVDLDIKRIKEVINNLEEAKVKFQIGFNRRFDHNFKRVHDLIQEGKIGKIHIVKITSWDPELPPLGYLKICGGIFLDMTIHDFDMVRFLTGSEVIEVFANATVLIDPDVGEICGDYDTAITSLKFENGAIGVIDNSRKALHGYDQRVEILGSNGTVSILNDTPSTTILSTDEGVCHEKPLHFFLERYASAFTEEVKEFYDVIINDKQPSVGAVDGLRSVEIGLAALKSAKENRPVKIEEIRKNK